MDFLNEAAEAAKKAAENAAGIIKNKVTGSPEKNPDTSPAPSTDEVKHPGGGKKRKSRKAKKSRKTRKSRKSRKSRRRR